MARVHLCRAIVGNDMLKFKNIDPCEKAVKILAWDKVSFEDGYEVKYPVKK